MKSRIIGKVAIDHQALAKDLNTVSQFPLIPEEYSEFGTGTWLNNSLMNADGDYNNTQYQDSPASGKPTLLWDKVPYITKLIQDNFDMTYLKMVRTRNLIDGMVIPHKDFVELNKNKDSYLRVFIPLEDNQNAFHSDEYDVFRMRSGEVWILNAAIVHAAANFSTENRVFLCLDFQFPEVAKAADIFLDKNQYRSDIVPMSPNRKPMSRDEIETQLDKYADMINKDNFKDIVLSLSKIHFHYQVNVAECYDWLVAIAEKSKSPELVDRSLSLQKYMVQSRSFGERYSF